MTKPYRELSAGEYPIFVGRGILEQIAQLIELSKYSKILLLTDEVVAAKLATKISQALNITHVLTIPAGEQLKSINGVEQIWLELIRIKADRSSLLINLGGGVIGDLGGFAAATYMRGIDFIQIPTTLLAQVDASVGGKTAINLGGIKNIIGSFKPPKAVIVDIDTLQTLPKQELLSGWAEVLKHGLIYSASYWEKCAAIKVQDFNLDQLEDIINESLDIKTSIVTRDPLESGDRKLLNFGHTLGHAIESMSHELGGAHLLLHGEAIMLGMLGESIISHKLGLLSKNELEVIEKGLKFSGSVKKLNKDFSSNKLIELIASDKKASHGKVAWTLLAGIGQGVINQEVPENLISDVILQLQS